MFFSNFNNLITSTRIPRKSRKTHLLYADQFSNRDMFYAFHPFHSERERRSLEKLYHVIIIFFVFLFSYFFNENYHSGREEIELHDQTIAVRLWSGRNINRQMCANYLCKQRSALMLSREGEKKK